MSQVNRLAQLLPTLQSIQVADLLAACPPLSDSQFQKHIQQQGAFSESATHLARAITAISLLDTKWDDPVKDARLMLAYLRGLYVYAVAIEQRLSAAADQPTMLGDEVMPSAAIAAQWCQVSTAILTQLADATIDTARLVALFDSANPVELPTLDTQLPIAVAGINHMRYAAAWNEARMRYRTFVDHQCATTDTPSSVTSDIAVTSQPTVRPG